MKAGKERSAIKLQERNFKLNTLLEVSNAINNIEYHLDLYKRFSEILTEKLKVGKAVLISDYNGWSVNIRLGLDFHVEENIIDGCLTFNRITVLNDNKHPVISKFDVIIPIFHKGRPLSFLLLGDFDGDRIEVSPIIRHLPFIQTLTNLIVVAQENRRLFDESIEKAAMQKELELASRMQSMLIPERIPERKDLDIFALYQPHQVVGGDYYDFFQVSEDETVFCMADISGKGISAAMLMSNFQAMMHAMMETDCDLLKTINALNSRIAINVKGEKFITAFISVYNHSKRELHYVNSGHHPALFCHDGKVTELKKGSSVLGIFEPLPHLEIGRQEVHPGDTMVCFTDGICEIENSEGMQFGTADMENIMLAHSADSARIVVDAIMAVSNKFRGDVEFPDDLALLAVRFGE